MDILFLWAIFPDMLELPFGRVMRQKKWPNKMFWTFSWHAKSCTFAGPWEGDVLQQQGFKLCASQPSQLPKPVNCPGICPNWTNLFVHFLECIRSDSKMDLPNLVHWTFQSTVQFLSNYPTYLTPVFPVRKVFRVLSVDNSFLGGIFICRREMSQYNIVSRQNGFPFINPQNDKTQRVLSTSPHMMI